MFAVYTSSATDEILVSPVKQLQPSRRASGHSDAPTHFGGSNRRSSADSLLASSTTVRLVSHRGKGSSFHR
jgi:hypothetical protein